ncbi:hypothetical protein I4U23_025556 [Adineta vaga]|nr:hypothetical protein I4U23_025556 [Adineta vaga]
MNQLTIFIYFLLILFVQFGQNKAVPTFDLSIEDIQNDPSAWYDFIENHKDKPLKSHLNHAYKRFLNDLLLPERQRRFGNTKYGRSISNE